MFKTVITLISFMMLMVCHSCSTSKTLVSHESSLLVKYDQKREIAQDGSQQLRLGHHFWVNSEKKVEHSFAIFSSKATRVEIYFYNQFFGEEEKLKLQLKNNNGHWSVDVTDEKIKESGVVGTIYYGYRMWGPNWNFDQTWVKGGLQGFISDVDAEGNRFNPNKLLIDPYALEISHDPKNRLLNDDSVFQSGEWGRFKDSGLYAPKSIVILDTTLTKSHILRSLKDEIIYEVHVRGLTQNDPQIKPEWRGTFKGATQKVKDLKKLGITAIEFLPVQETQNDLNDIQQSTYDQNYWGYLTLNYFSPDRRLSYDKSAGGPTREFKEMVEAFHQEGIKVYIDVVYNHTAEGGLGQSKDQALIYSYRGIDNSSYYLLTNDSQYYWDNTGIGHNLNTAQSITKRLVIDSLKYWHLSMGVDGFRFDLAPVLGNKITQGGFWFDKMQSDGLLNMITRELPARNNENGFYGVDLIAEPWTVSSFQQGQFPWGWAEWNSNFRDSFRKHFNKEGFDFITIGELAKRFSGSPDLFQVNGRKPYYSINFIDAHDGFTLFDLFKYNEKNNQQGWPFGPSDGGANDNNSWDQGGSAEQQRQAARNAMAVLMLSAGVPMFQGGDELLRSLQGNNNAYNVDSIGTWINWSTLDTPEVLHFRNYTSKLIELRKQLNCLSPDQYWQGIDHNQNGLKDVTWHKASGEEIANNEWTDPQQRFLSYRLDLTECESSGSNRTKTISHKAQNLDSKAPKSKMIEGESLQSVMIFYNGQSREQVINLPHPYPGKRWYRVLDTSAWFENRDNINNLADYEPINDLAYKMTNRSILVLIEK